MSLSISILLFVSTIILLQIYILFCKKNRILLIIDDYKRKNIVNSSGIILFFLCTLISCIIYSDENLKNIIELEVPRPVVFIISIFILSCVSLYDDIKPIDFRIRLAFQISTIFFSVSLIEFNFFPEIPLKLKQYVIIFFWVYFINLNNFLDGLDGYLLLNFINILAIIVIKYYFDNELIISSLIAINLLPVILAFLIFNFPKAKMFLGDTGSYIIGFLTGYIFFDLIKNSEFYIAFLIILYQFSDVSITIFKKIMNGKKPWDRLFDYFFLKPVIKYRLSHLHSSIPFIIYSIINNLILVILYFKMDINLLVIILLNILNLSFLLIYFSNPVKFLRIISKKN